MHRSIQLLTLVLALVLTAQQGAPSFFPVISQLTPDYNSPDQQNIRTLYCEVSDGQGGDLPVENVEYYVDNDIILQDVLTGEEIEHGDDGATIFEITQALEGRYTCGNDTTFRSSDQDALSLVSIPVQNPIPVYYSTPVDGSVKIECGISLGKLASAYSVTWIYKVFRDVEDQGGTRFEVIRNSLMDMSLEISSVLLEDNSMYFCEVTISDAGQIVKTFESPDITLIVYEAPKILFLTEDKFLSVDYNNDDDPPLQFTCSATGSPQLKLQWTHNGNNILSNTDKYMFVDSSPMSDDSTDVQLESISSILNITEPGLLDTGNITCMTSVEYDGGPSGVDGDVKITRVAERKLLVLDTSLQPRPIETLDGDLLIRVDLPSTVEIDGAITVQVNMIPKDMEEHIPVSFTIDGVFSDVTTFYPFIPASQLLFRQFWIQIALRVNDNMEGPLNPSNVTAVQYIDFDSEDSSSDCEPTISHQNIKILSIAIPAAVVIGALIIAAVCAIIYIVKRHTKRKLVERSAVTIDKTMVIYKQLLDKAWEKLDRVTGDELDKIYKKIDKYDEVLTDLAREVMGGAFCDDGVDEDGVETTVFGGESEESRKESLKARIDDMRETINGLAVYSEQQNGQTDSS